MPSREKYIDELYAKLKKWDQQIDDLQQRATQSGEEARARLNERVSQLKEKREEIKQKAEDLRNAGSSAVETLKSGLKKAADEIAASLDMAYEEFKK